LSALGLTRREAQLLRLVASGKSDAAIGGELCIATDTVKKHLQRIYRKLDVHSRTAAVAKVLEAV
jgi:DNA-binding CsgD family transcriptional regulator